MARASLFESMTSKAQPRTGAGSGTREIRCYHCKRDFRVSVHARSAACPHCYRGLCLDDLVVRGLPPASGAPGKLQTCGQVVVEKKSAYVGQTVEAVEGVEVHGRLEAHVTSRGPVVLGSQAQVKGDLTAPSLRVEPGAVIKGGFFRIGAFAGEGGAG